MKNHFSKEYQTFYYKTELLPEKKIEFSTHDEAQACLGEEEGRNAHKDDLVGSDNQS
jgi:hypothetical protein